MKNIFFLIIVPLLALTACTPVLRKDLMKSGSLEINPESLKQDSLKYIGNLYILGGIIAKTTVTSEGSIIEAIYVPVDSRGYLKNTAYSNWRYLALYRSDDFLDPVIFGEKRKITIAGEFKGTRKGMIGSREYTFPLFEIKDIHLWEETPDRDLYMYPEYYPPAFFRYRPYYPAYPYYFWWYY
jgi:outer membrane lipoprotein